MKALLFPFILGVLGVCGGIGAGLYLTPDIRSEDSTTHNKNAEGKNTEYQQEHAEEDGSTEFARLNNQFIVPVVRNEDVSALVVLSVTLEVETGGTVAVFEREPRLRDRFLRVLFDHANVGGFDAGFTQSGTMAILRKSLREAATDTLGPIVRDVLIVDIVRQEV